MSANEKKIKSDLKYRLYEASVQDADQQLGVFEKAYDEIIGRKPLVMREDFCGTFLLAAEWVKRDKERSALGLDIDPEPLAYGKKKRLAKLAPSTRRRLKILRQNVLSTTTPKADLIVACNFSFYTFHQRSDLMKYFQHCRRSLQREGIVVLEMVGGAGFIESPYREQRKQKYESGKRKGEHWFTYIWEHRSYNPVLRNGHYAINFKMPNGDLYRDAFYYDWRLWSIPEVRDALSEAGFRDTVVYWEAWDEDGADAFQAMGDNPKEAEDDHTWICYVVGVK